MFTRLERRKFYRLEFPIEVTVEIIPGEGGSRELPLAHFRSRNIATTGICLEAESLDAGGVNLLAGAPYARENRLLMKMGVIPDEPPICALGEVRWYDVVRDETGSFYLMGVEFLEIKDNGKAQLARFLKLHKRPDR